MLEQSLKYPWRKENYMQFLPTSTSSNVSALGGIAIPAASAAAQVTGNANAFLESLNDELSAAGITPVVDPSQVNGPPLGFRTVTHDPSAKINQEDANAILANLKKKGVKDSALVGIEELLASGQTLTLGSIAGALGQNGRKGAELTDAEIQELGGILRKMQFSQEESDELITMMQNGYGFAAMRAISGKLSKIDTDGTFSIDMSELRALARGLDLSENAMKKIAALMNGAESAEVNSKGLEALLGPMTEELAAERSEKEKIARELKDAINTALQDKKLREVTDPVADTRGSKKSERAETRMRDDLMFKNKNILSPEDEEALLMREEENAFANQQDTRNRNTREHAAMADAHKTDSHKTVSVNGSAESGKTSSKSEAATTLFNRLDIASGMTAPAPSSSAAPQQAASTANFNRQELFSQVEQGLLKQLADGSRQMTLRLDPAELGQLSLILTVKGGEVRALIRTESSETTALLTEQMNQLRATLEEQGLKVAQLDVETQLPKDTTQDTFSGMDQYNREQELREQARFLQLAKLRRESGESLAQVVQSKKAEEEISPNGLHIIA